MRKLIVTCDVCQKPVDDFNGGVTVAAGWGETVRADACSVKCVVIILKGLAVEIEEKGEKIAADNAAFSKLNPGAVPIENTPAWDTKKWGTFGPPVATTAPVSKRSVPKTSPSVAAVAENRLVDAGLVDALKKDADAGSVPTFVTPSEPRPAAGCAACDAGVEYSGETAHRHTGEGKLCSEAANEGKFKPCSCPPENWKMDPPDNNPGQHEVACQKCGNCWTVNIGGSAEPKKKGKGRPAGSKNRKTLEAEAAAAEANGASLGTIPAETPENKAQRDAALGRAPDTSVDTSVDEFERLKASREKPATNGTAPVSKENPAAARENLSQLVTDLGKLGIALNLMDVAKWTSMQLDLVRSWVAHPEFDPPEVLAGIAEANVVSAQAASSTPPFDPMAGAYSIGRPAPQTPPEKHFLPKSRFTF